MTVGIPSWMVPPEAALDPVRTIRTRVLARRRVATDVVEFTLCADGATLPDWTPGAHIDVHLPEARIRQYSLCGDPGDRGVYRIAVLRAPDGRGGSRFLHDEIDEGDTLSISPPRQHFGLVDAADYLFIAGGIGITPILPMLDAVRSRGASWSLVYCGRNASSMAYRENLRSDPRVSVRTSEPCERLDTAELLAAQPPGTAVYCCGPESLMKAAEHAVDSCAGMSIHVERFAPIDVDLPVRPFDVTLVRSSRELHVPADRALIDVLEDAGVVVPASCREGTCGTCETTVLDGTPEHRDSVLSPAEQAVGDCMMVCVSRSCGASLTLDL